MLTKHLHKTRTHYLGYIANYFSENVDIISYLGYNIPSNYKTVLPLLELWNICKAVRHRLNTSREMIKYVHTLLNRFAKDIRPFNPNHAQSTCPHSPDAACGEFSAACISQSEPNAVASGSSSEQEYIRLCLHHWFWQPAKTCIYLPSAMRKDNTADRDAQTLFTHQHRQEH